LLQDGANSPEVPENEEARNPGETRNNTNLPPLTRASGAASPTRGEAGTNMDFLKNHLKFVV
jgi:hypothetical protein